MQVGRTYRILETIGRGGCGRVYHAEIEEISGFRREVAVKVLQNDEGEPHRLQRLRDEGRVLGMLRHPAIVQVHSLTELDRGWAVVMEYVPGVDVSALPTLGPVPLRAIARIIEEVASALSAAWSTSGPDGRPLRLIHRDIKPSNIRVTPNGEVKVLDFGIARAEFDKRESHTKSLMMGTMRYMAPERLEGVDEPAGDVYGLGMVAVRLLLGRVLKKPPARDADHKKFMVVLRKHLLERAEAEGAGRAGTELVGMVLAMLAHDPGSRPSAAAIVGVCRNLEVQLGGPSLRGWAETAVPRIEAALEKHAETGVLVGQVLREKAEAAAEMPTLNPPEPVVPASDGRLPPALRREIIFYQAAVIGLVTLSAVLAIALAVGANPLASAP